MSVILRKVEHSDLERIQSLFKAVYGKAADKGFQLAFTTHNDLLGYCLEESKKGDLVGYFGCFTNQRVYADRPIKYYNTHSWIVKEQYRNQSLKLLMPYLKLKDGIITNFSANGKVAQVLEKLKFDKQEIKNYLLTTRINWLGVFKQSGIKELPIQELILKDHQAFVGLCLSLHFTGSDKPLNMILKPIDRKPQWVQTVNSIFKLIIRKPLITRSYRIWKIHYLSDAVLFKNRLSLLKSYFLLKHKIGGLVVHDDIADKMDDLPLEYSHSDTIFLKLNQIELKKVDYLYSEVFYLNIADK